MRTALTMIGLGLLVLITGPLVIILRIIENPYDDLDGWNYWEE